MSRTTQAKRRAGGGALLLALTATVFGLGVQRAGADGTETLGPPSVTVAAGTGFVIAGVGMETQPASVSITVPAGANVVQVLAYWDGHHSELGVGADNTVVIGGSDVTGTLIGGPTFLF